MKKALAGVLLLLAVVLGTLGTATAAQAYGPDTPPSVSPPQVHSSTPQGQGANTPTVGTLPKSGALPNTGGPSMVLLGGAVVLIIIGGVVLVTRRRHAETD